MKTHQIKAQVLLVSASYSMGVLISTLVLGHMTIFAWSSLVGVPLIIAVVWYILRPLKYYKFNHRDCPTDHDEMKEGSLCKLCGVAVEEDEWWL